LLLVFKEAEQALTSRLKLEYADMVESYETRLKQLSTSSSLKIKEEPIDCHSQKPNLSNHLLEMQVMKDRLEQAQIDLGLFESIFIFYNNKKKIFYSVGKCQTENAILNAKLLSREQQSDIRFKELNNQYIRVKKQYDHMSSCIKDFHLKLYQKKRLKTEIKEDTDNKFDGENNDSNDDIIEVIMQTEPMVS